jgi:hypothetical protein
MMMRKLIPSVQRTFALAKRASSAGSVVPHLVELASNQGIDFLLLVDLDFFMANSNREESSFKNIINEKMEEFNNLKRLC